MQNSKIIVHTIITAFFSMYPVVSSNAIVPVEQPTQNVLQKCFSPMGKESAQDLEGSIIPLTPEQYNSEQIQLGQFHIITSSQSGSAAATGAEVAKPAIKPKKHYSTPSDIELMKRICRLGHSNGMVSPLCGNWELFGKLKAISTARGVPFGLAIGITLSESTIGTAFKSTSTDYDDSVCADNNNWAGLKARTLDNGKSTREYTDGSGNTVTASYPDAHGCWLYPFHSVEDFWTSFNNTIKYGYIKKGLSTPTAMAAKYLGTGADPTFWVGNIHKLYVLDTSTTDLALN